MTLRAKILVALTSTTIIVCCVIGWAVARHSTQQQALFMQQANQTLAQNLLDENVLYTDGQLNPAALDNIFHTLMVINPSIEVYLLEPDGGVYMHSAPEDAAVAGHVELEPIQRFLAGAPLPIAGTNPRANGRTSAFSAAPVAIDNGRNGFLYVVLNPQTSPFVLNGPGRYQTLELIGLITVAVAFLAVVMGGLVMRLITRRILRTDAAVRQFTQELANPDSLSPLALSTPPTGTGDEIDSINRHIETMSETIVHQLGQLATTDNLRRQLIANVSHDLRTPLTAVEGYLQTVLVKPLDGKTRRQYVEVAWRSAKRLRHLIVELFELSRLEAEKRQISAEDFSIAELISDVLQKLALVAEKRSVTLDMEVEPRAAHARGEIGLIERVLDNLLVNAINHSPAGSRITVSLGEGSSGTVRVSVADQGVGIAEEDLPYIFDRFYRPNTSTAGKTEGAGLGLAIVRRIMELHRSRVEAASKPGRGSTFIFWLPAASASG